MAYPQGSASDNFASTLYTSDFSPAIVCGGIIDDYTPVSNIGMKNSVGYQVSLVQNFVNQQYLGRSAYRISEGWVNTLYTSGINFDGTDTYNTILCSGIFRIMAPESSIAGFTLSGNYVGINKHDPEYELDVYGDLRIKNGSHEGIVFTGSNGTYSQIKCATTESSELYIECNDSTNAVVHLNSADYGGVIIGASTYVTPDSDLWTYAGNGTTFNSGIINWSDDADISGFDSYLIRELHARRVGRQITVYFSLRGTTDDMGNIGFQLPESSIGLGSGQLYYGGSCRGMDNQGSTNASWSIQPGERHVRFSPTNAAYEYDNNFTTAAFCGVEGTLIYEV